MFDFETKFVPVSMELFGFVHGFSLLGSFLSYSVVKNQWNVYFEKRREKYTS